MRDIDESGDVLEHFLDFLANGVGIDLLNLFLEDFDFLFWEVEVLSFEGFDVSDDLSYSAWNGPYVLNEVFGELSVFGVFGLLGIADNVIDFLFDVLELDSEAFIELGISFVFVIGSDDFDELFEIFFDVLVINE